MSRSATKSWMPMMLAVFCILAVALQLGVIFLFLALLPAAMTWITDRDKGQPTFKVVAACNIAATLPSVMPMLAATLSMKHYDIAPLMGNLLNWMYVYSGAAAGWGLVYLCRFIANFLVTLTHEFQINSLEHTQARLVEEWGEQITHPPGR